LHVLKRWAAWPQGIRWLAGIAAVVLVLAIVWVLFVPIADWLARHDVGSVRGPLYETAVDNARARLLTLAAGLFAAWALVFTALNFTLSRRTFQLTEQGQVTERYTKAIEQLGSDKLDVRIGGIYALERIARDSAKDHPTVMEVLTAFIREHSREHRPVPEQGPHPEPPRAARPDAKAAITVVGRRDAKRDIRRVDLTGADLSRVDLTGANLSGANLTLADLSRANLSGADLGDADLRGANLSGANLTLADLSDADLSGANLTLADLRGADLSRADLSRADLTLADLSRADLSGADLILADLGRANLTRADLSGANLSGALWPQDAAVPEGWKRDTGSGRLSTAGTGGEAPGAG
jgi:hypothetical protein